QRAEADRRELAGRDPRSRGGLPGRRRDLGAGAGYAEPDAQDARVGPDADAAGPDARRHRVKGSVAAIAGLALVSALTPVIGATPVTGDLVRIETSAPHMGTLVRIVLYAPSTAAGEAAAQAAFARIADIDARL